MTKDSLYFIIISKDFLKVLDMKEKNKVLILLAVSSFITGLSVTFSKYFGFMEWFSLIGLFFALEILRNRENLKYKHAYLYGLFYFECFYVVTFHWFLNLYPLDFTGLNNFYSILVIFFAWFGLSLLQAVFGGLVFVLYIAISRSRLAKQYGVINFFSFTMIYTFYEFTQTLGWWGVPWARLALGQSELLIPIQTASLFGSYFITSIILLVNSAIAYAFIHRSEIKKRNAYAILAISVFLLNLFAGTILYVSNSISTKDNPTIKSAVIQSNYSSSEKWIATAYSILQKHIELTISAANDGAKLIIWPETALPYSLTKSGASADKISELAKEYQITIIVGAIYHEDEKEYNSLFCFLPDGSISETLYHKRHLVPFGEYVPLRNAIEKIAPFMSEISMLDEDMTPGEDSALFYTEFGKIGSLICFDSIYETLAKSSVNDGAEAIILATNDSWFFDSAAIYMHNNQARLRAIEFRRDIARAANTGISSFITSEGKITSKTEPLTEDYLVSEISLSSQKTLYSIIGNSFVYLCGLAVSIPLLYDLIINISNKKQQKVNNCFQKVGYEKQQADLY